MKSFLDDNFLLSNKSAERLYHNYAKQMPIIDYHCHLPPDLIANNHQFDNLTQIWLNGDHYKWRAMRTNGVNEDFITGGKTDYEKFEKWAATVPYTMRNPLYHWTHLELQRYFNINELLTSSTAKNIYDECTAKLKTPDYTVSSLIEKM
jgi:glucuronate isomerase